MLDLGPSLVFVGLTAAAVVVVAVVVLADAWTAKKRHHVVLARVALRHGLEFSPQDPYGLAGWGFELFKRAPTSVCRNVLTGTWKGRHVRLAEFSPTRRQSPGTTPQQFSVLLVSIDARLPHVRIKYEVPFPPWVEDIKFESEQFNRRFRVQADDRQFAYKLLDGRMIQWLLATAGSHCYEVGGMWVLVYTRLLPPSRLTTLLNAGTAFVDHVPRLVWADYGTEASS